ncbi:hypothetical protein, partial [Prosthecochloris ethylica]|uniref:hypothetical protein n=1 Tax=Prosthecochloris ethylica TaxID=2743976 RepID=UPI001A92B88A
IRYPLSVIRYPLSVIRYPQGSYRRPGEKVKRQFIHFPYFPNLSLSPVSCLLSPVSCLPGQRR